jgi:uncharacterized protein involved in response to NO
MAALNRLFSEGYRAFFLATALYAILAMAVWTLWLATAGETPLPGSMAPQLWHGHELTFGFGTAALGGFFLTAVPNWTGAKAAPARFIAVAVGLWLLGRLAFWGAASLPPIAVALADLAFLPLLGAKIASQLLRRPKPQNMMFLGLLTIVWIANLYTHLEFAGLAQTASSGLRAGLFGLVAMIAVLGGRVTPAFTRNAMQRDGIFEGQPQSRVWLDRPGIALAIVLPLATLLLLPAPAVASVTLLAGVFQLARLWGWSGRYALGQPILLTLHVSFGLIGSGLILLGMAGFGLGSEVAALHLLAIGGVGGMVMAMKSRASLGHSGRALQASWPLVAAYVLLPVAAGLRWLASTLPDYYLLAALAAGTVWILAFVLSTATLWPAFWAPRVTGAGRK